MPAAKVAVFRFEASTSVGAGHAFRSQTLMHELLKQGWICHLVASNETRKYLHWPQEYSWIAPEEFLQHPFSHRLLIVDSYDLGLEFETALRPHCEKILVFEDSPGRKHNCDYLLDSTPFREAHEYAGLVPKHCHLFLGLPFVLIRDEILQLRPSALLSRQKNSHVDRILISLGGSPSAEVTLNVLTQILKVGFAGAIDVVLGINIFPIGSLESFAKLHPNKINFYFSPNLPALIGQTQLAVGAAGGSCFERACLGLPQVLLPIAGNQDQNYQTLIENKLVLPLSEIAKALRQPTHSTTFSRQVDGLGKKYLLLELLPELSLKDLHFVPVQEKDSDLLFAWQQIPSVRKFAREPRAPSQNEHTQWFRKKMSEPWNPHWILQYQNKPVGSVHLNYNSEKNWFEVSWYLNPNSRNQGLGTSALKKAAFLMEPFQLHGYVQTGNIASKKAFIGAGFTQIDDNNFIS